jgi:hypothetical protein
MSLAYRNTNRNRTEQDQIKTFLSTQVLTGPAHAGPESPRPQSTYASPAATESKETIRTEQQSENRIHSQKPALTFHSCRLTAHTNKAPASVTIKSNAGLFKRLYGV